MSGIRVRWVPREATEKDLKAYFSNPNHGGGKITSIHYPLFDEEAVIIFQEEHTAETVLTSTHKLMESPISVKGLPQFQVFTKLQAEIDPAVSSFLETSEAARDELVHHANIDYHYNKEKNISYMTGTWYQLEWAWKGISDFMHMQQKALIKSAYKKDAHDQLGTSMRAEEYSPERDITATDRLKSLKLEQKTGVEDNESIQLTKGTMKIPGDNITISMPTGTNFCESSEAAPVNVDTRAGVRNSGGFEVKAAAEFKPEGRSCKVQRALSEEGTFNVTGSNTRTSRSLSVEDRDSMDLMEIEFSHGGLKVSFYTGDITLSETDAIVNSGMENQLGVSLAISRAAGLSYSQDVEKYFAKHRELETGEVMWTRAGGSLHKNVRCVLHTVGPLWTADLSQDVGAYQLTKTFFNCLNEANGLKLKSLVFPAISTGTLMVSVEVCAKCFLDAILLFTYEQQSNQCLKEVHLVNEHADATANMVLAVRQQLKRGMDLLTVEAIEEKEEMDKKMKKSPGLYKKVKAKVSDFLWGSSKAVTPMGPTSGIPDTQKKAVTVKPPTDGRPLPKPQVQTKAKPGWK